MYFDKWYQNLKTTNKQQKINPGEFLASETWRNLCIAVIGFLSYATSRSKRHQENHYIPFLNSNSSWLEAVFAPVCSHNSHSEINLLNYEKSISTITIRESNSM
jgi:hypothetical protein